MDVGEEQEESVCDVLARSLDFGEARASVATGYDPDVLENAQFGPGQHRSTLNFLGYVVRETRLLAYVKAASGLQCRFVPGQNNLISDRC